MKRANIHRFNLMILSTFISLILISYSGCSLLDSLDAKAHVRFKNNTSESFAGVRIPGGAESNSTFGPSAITGYMDNGPGNFGVEVKVGETWTFVYIPDGNSLALSTGSDYTVTISGAAGNYTAAQVKD